MQEVMQELLRHSSFRSTLDVYAQAVTPAKHCGAGGGDIAGLFVQQGWNGTRCWIRDCGPPEKGTERARKRALFWVLDGFTEIRVRGLEGMAGTTRLELATSTVTA